MDQRIIDLHDEYQRGVMDRRNFLERLSGLAGGSAAALTLLPMLENNYAQAQTIAENDSRLVTSDIKYKAGDTDMSGYLARPKAGGRHPAVIVIHEIYGLNAHIRDVDRRVAVEGFLALAPDMLSPVGGTPPEGAKGTVSLRDIETADHVARLAATVRYLASHEESNGKVGVVGFCWGGGIANQLAAAGTSLNAAVPYYGSQLPAEDVPKITAPLLLHYGSLDERINKGIPDYETALKANNKTYEIHMYEGAGHAFNNDTNQSRYNKAAAELAWDRTIKFFKNYLSP